MATQRMTPLQASSQYSLQLTYEQLAIFAGGHPNNIVSACRGNRAMTKALLLWLVTTRDEKLADAAQAGDVPKRIRGELESDLLLYLWGHQHEGFLWLCNRSSEWNQGFMSNAIPWNIILDASEAHPEWRWALNAVFTTWKPHQLHAQPTALKYIENPTEMHVLMAACGGQEGYMDPKQIDALRPGASQWFEMRKNLVPGESRKQATKAFQLWWHQGRAKNIEGLDGAVFESPQIEF